MKKIFFFFSLLLLILSGCSNDDLDQVENSIKTSLKSSQIRWYGTKLSDSDEIQTRGVADEGKLWNPRVGIYVKFINSPTDPTMIERIKEIASEWEEYAGITFHFVENTLKADVRIAFDWNGNDWLTWSYTGTDAKFVHKQNEPTAVFGGLQYQSDEMFKGDVLRLFGQILGLEYEQRHQKWSFWRSESQLKRYWESMFDGLDMNWDEIREYVFTPLTGNNSIYPTQTDEVDEQSVMGWPYYSRVHTTNLLANFQLSEGDKTFIAQLYPKDEKSLPTIQKAWVDAGYFEWIDTNRNSLKITKLGRLQDYLPDVSDGEQLTSASYMFMDSRIKVIPKFNTSNITNFREMFKNCPSLKTVPILNTSKGTNFEGMFYVCESLISIPLLDTSKGTNFKSMFIACESLKSIPLLDTSNGDNFHKMFLCCSSLKSIPLLDTSKGTNFDYMFYGCQSLSSIPELNTSKGTNFEWMFYRCQSLRGIPELNTSKGTNFEWMFSYCRSLNEKPKLIIPEGASTTGMYYNTTFQ